MSDLPVEVRTYPDRQILYVERRSDENGSFEEAAPGAIHALMQYVQETNAPVRFETFCGITPDDMRGDRAHTRYWAAVEIAGDPTQLTPSQDVQVGTLAGGKELVYVAQGSYDNLPQWWETFEAYRAARNIPFRGPSYEAYVDDPSTTPEAELRTELRIPIHEVFG